jgi:hypothetical protein
MISAMCWAILRVVTRRKLRYTKVRSERLVNQLELILPRQPLTEVSPR